MVVEELVQRWVYVYQIRVVLLTTSWCVSASEGL